MSAGRKYLTAKETADKRAEQGDLCACGCGRPLGASIIREHTIPNFFVPGKPDALWRKDCADAKTKTDMARIAKTRRQAGETGQQKRRRERERPLIRSAGFQGHRKFDGTPVWKDRT